MKRDECEAEAGKHYEEMLLKRIEDLQQDKEELLNELYPNPMQVVLDDEAKMPKKAHPSDAGFDLHSTASGRMMPGDQFFVPTGVKVAIPHGYYGRVAPRSGLAAKHGIHVMAGVIDSGYRDAIGVILYNSGSEVFEFEKGHRIAQLVIERIFTGELTQVENLTETPRGMGGYGSTGA